MTHSNLALAYREAGCIAEAIALLDRTLPDSERTPGGTHPSTLAIPSYLAAVCQAAGSTADAPTARTRPFRWSAHTERTRPGAVLDPTGACC